LPAKRDIIKGGIFAKSEIINGSEVAILCTIYIVVEIIEYNNIE
jgi:hypothetical protein